MFGFMIVAGTLLADIPKGTEKIEAAGVHKSLGLLVLVLVLLRLVCRLINVTPLCTSCRPYSTKIRLWPNSSVTPTVSCGSCCW